MPDPFAPTVKSYPIINAWPLRPKMPGPFALILIPPLRERIQDILPLTKHFLEKNCHSMQRPIMHLDKEALEALEAYPWPGCQR